MEFEKITELIQAVSKSDLTNFYMEEGNLKISMKAGKKARVKGLQTAPVVVQGAENLTEQEEVLSQKSAPQGKTIKSPLVGTFYNADLRVQRFLYRRVTP